MLPARDAAVAAAIAVGGPSPPPPPAPGSAAVAADCWLNWQDVEQWGGWVLGWVSKVIWGGTRIVGRACIMLANKEDAH